MRRKIKGIIFSTLSMALAISMLLGAGTGLPVNAEENGTTTYSEAGQMEIVSRRVTKSELYAAVSEEQKTENENNPVAVKDEVLKVNFNEADIIDYVRFSGSQKEPAERKSIAGGDFIGFEAKNITEAVGVEDWTNLEITSREQVASHTATNFRGEGAELVFTVPTENGKAGIFTVYAGGHPNTGTITATAALGEERLKAVAGNTAAESYAFTPNSSQVTEYKVSYVGDGRPLTVIIKATDVGDKDWAGVCVAGALLRSVETEAPEEIQQEEVQIRAAIAKKIVSNGSLFDKVEADQKQVSEANPLAVGNEVVKVDLTTADVIDYLRFTGEEAPVRKSNVGEEKLSFTTNHKTIEAISDWNNLMVDDEDGNPVNTATNFQGEGSVIEVSVPTVKGEKRTLDIYAGGHPNTGTYTAAVTLGNHPVKLSAGNSEADQYSYTPGSSQIVHYQIDYVGTGETLKFSLSLSGTEGVSWAGISVAAVALRQDIATISPQEGYFNKSVSDAQYRDLDTTISAKAGVGLAKVELNGQLVPQEGYTYEEASRRMVLKTDYLKTLEAGEHTFSLVLSDQNELTYRAVISDAAQAPRPYVKDSSSLSNQNLDAWNLWYQDEFDSAEGKLDDWWEPSYLRWWNYSSENNEKYNVIYKDDSAVDHLRGTDGSVLKQFTTPTMRADSIVTRSDNFRNPGITLGARDLIHNYGPFYEGHNLMNYQHIPTDDRGATAYGYFEVRAKITGGYTEKTKSGSSAWWFTGFQDASWQTMEVDMVEYGYNNAAADAVTHFSSPNHPWRDVFAGSQPKSWDSANYGVANPKEGYHIYGVEWTPDAINGYFDGVKVWSKSVSVNYRMLMWISLNAHATNTYITDGKEHYFDYIRIWKTDALAELEKEMVTKNIIQKLQPKEDNVATLAYAGANGISSFHYKQWDPGFMNDNDPDTSFKAMTSEERKSSARTSYNSDAYYLYLDWVNYTEDEVKKASKDTEMIEGADGKTYTLASEYDVRRAKTVNAVELVVNKEAGYETINKGKSDNKTGNFVYDLHTESANLFPYMFDIEYSADGYNGWTPIAADVKAEWDFGKGNTASFLVNVPTAQNVNHLRIHVKSVWNSDTNEVVGLENGFYIAEIKVYESKQETEQAEARPGTYQYNHAAYAAITVTDKDNQPGSEDINFPVKDVADGVYVNEFRSSGDSRDASDGDIVNINKPVTVLEPINGEAAPQYINFEWDTERKIDDFAITIGYMHSAPTKFALEYYDGSKWVELAQYTRSWQKDFETFRDASFDAVTTNKMRVKIIEANDGKAINLVNQGVQGGITVRIAPGYYSIAEIELNETK